MYPVFVFCIILVQSCQVIAQQMAAIINVSSGMKIVLLLTDKLENMREIAKQATTIKIKAPKMY